MSYTTLKEHSVILCMSSTIHALVFQMGFIKDLKLAFVVLIKHVFI